MHRLFYLLSCVAIWSGVFTRLLAGEYQSTDGDIFKGDPVSFTEEGVIFKLDIGGYSQRVRWGRLKPESLKELAKDANAASFARPFIEDAPESRPPPRPKPVIKLNPIENRLPRYQGIGFVEAWTSPMALFILLVVYGANLYAAYEIARFRNRPPALICGVSAFLPVFGPLIFLSLPTLDEAGQEIQPAIESAEAPPPVSGARATQAVAASGGLGIAKAAAKAEPATTAEPSVYKRGDYTFNRRFIETKFANFFRMISSDDAALVIRTNKNEIVAKRITRISSSEMHVQLLHGGTEQMVSFGDILEFHIRKGGKA